MSLWTFPFADSHEGRLDHSQWVWISICFIVIHISALGVSVIIGNFDPLPNADHVTYMNQVLSQGYPVPSHWPPAYSYYMAFKWRLTELLGLPYWSAKIFVDMFLVVGAGVLSVRLGQVLTRNRVVAVSSGIGLTAAPIYILGVSEELAVILFQPIFIAAILLFVLGLQRQTEPSYRYFILAGFFLGLACLVRGNPQFLFVYLAPFVLWFLMKNRATLPIWRAAVLMLVFVGAQTLATLPWSLLQRSYGGQSTVTFGGIYESYFDGVNRYKGNRISDWLDEHFEQPTRSFSGVVKFNVHWLFEDPSALVGLYASKAVGAWYRSDSGRWDMYILLLHVPLWIVAVTGACIWARKYPHDPALYFVLLVMAYMWTVSAIMAAIARYSAPLYTFIGILGGVSIETASKWWSDNRPG